MTLPLAAAQTIVATALAEGRARSMNRLWWSCSTRAAR